MLGSGVACCPCFAVGLENVLLMDMCAKNYERAVCADTHMYIYALTDMYRWIVLRHHARTTTTAGMLLELGPMQ